MSVKKFHVVVFEEEQSTAIIPDLWLRGNNSAVWPPYKTSLRQNSAVQNEEVPGESWAVHPIRLLYSGSWESARHKLKKSEDTSDLQSDCDPPAKRQKSAPRRLYEDEDDDVSEDEQPAAAASGDDEDDAPVILQKTKQQLPKPPTPLSLFPRRRDDNSEGPSSSRSSLRRPTPPSTPATPSLIDARQSKIQEARDTRIFTMLEHQQEQLQEQTRLLRLILARGSAHDAVPSELPEGISFPLKTVEDLAAFEERMSQANAATSVVKYLAEYGGSDSVDTVSRIMKAVMITNLARQYNLTGTKQKKKLDGLHLINILFRCLQLNPSTRSCSRKEMEGAIQKWLSGARDREGGRKDRARVNPVLQE